MDWTIIAIGGSFWLLCFAVSAYAATTRPIKSLLRPGDRHQAEWIQDVSTNLKFCYVSVVFVAGTGWHVGLRGMQLAGTVVLALVIGVVAGQSIRILANRKLNEIRDRA